MAEFLNRQVGPTPLQLFLNRRVQPTLSKFQRESVISQGQRGKIPDGVDYDLTQRIRNKKLLKDEKWYSYKKGFKTIRCRIRGVYLGSNYTDGYQWADQPLYVIEVHPLQKLPTSKPPNSETPYHISVAFWDPQKRKLFEELERKYSQSRTVTLRGEIEGSSFKLDTKKCPVGSDELVKKLHSTGHYKNRPLHISL